MKLIVDSGSSKLDWAVIQYDKIIDHGASIGSNPTIDHSFKFSDEILKYKSKITTVEFYGSGLGSIANKNMIKKQINAEFDNVKNYTLNSDLLGAARACFQNNEGIICILGTGSNVAYYNGSKLIQDTPSLGYILGDEGSGAHIGKSIIKAYFYNKMDTENRLIFEQHFETNKSTILHHLYKENKPNKYIAQFAQFLIFATESFKTDILNNVFDQFINERLMNCYKIHPVDISFVGSIAFKYESYLKEHMKKYNLKLKSTLQSPIHALINYHTKL